MVSRIFGPKIHPIIIYPFSDPSNKSDLTYLYDGLVALIRNAPRKYEEVITVLNRQTYYVNRLNTQFTDFLHNYVDDYSRRIDAWCVDTCQMWLAGLGAAFDESRNEGDVFWLIPGDVKYSEYSRNNGNKNILQEMEKLPDTVLAKSLSLCIGEIEVDKNNSKELIDTYGTYGLLANWFPYEAKEIRKLTNKPRTEFFAVSHSFLRHLLSKRWYAYEQTLVMLLHCLIGGRSKENIGLGKLSDLSQGRDTLSATMQQLERTERVLKLFWREQNQNNLQWIDAFQKLDSQSEQIRSAALIILENLL